MCQYGGFDLGPGRILRLQGEVLPGWQRGSEQNIWDWGHMSWMKRNMECKTASAH